MTCYSLWVLCPIATTTKLRTLLCLYYIHIKGIEHTKSWRQTFDLSRELALNFNSLYRPIEVINTTASELQSICSLCPVRQSSFVAFSHFRESAAASWPEVALFPVYDILTVALATTRHSCCLSYSIHKSWISATTYHQPTWGEKSVLFLLFLTFPA